MSLEFEIDSITDANVTDLTGDDILEEIGQKILLSWDGEADGTLNQTLISDPLQEIFKMLESPNKYGSKWETKLKMLIEKLSPTDFAIYGKQICLKILEAKCLRSVDDQCTKIPIKNKVDKLNLEKSPTKKKSNKITKPVSEQLYTEFPEWLPTYNDF